MSDNWVPLGMDRADLAVLHEGVPNWMHARFYQWIDAASKNISRYYGSDAVRLVAEFDERTRMNRPLAPGAAAYRLSTVLLERKNGMLSLRFADFLLAKSETFGVPTADLEDVLSLSGSAWRVGERAEFVGLERRVPVGVQEAADAVMVNAGNAGRILSEAWHALYGINPDYDAAYKKAILAVEAAGGQKVTPKDTVGTLGKMTTAMRDQGWALPLADDPRNPSSDVLWKMAKAMVAGEQSRHATSGTYTPATAQDAESTVYLAVALVQFFHAGLAQKR